jgi:hypothetical protein
MAYRPLRRRSIAASLTIALEDQVARPIPAKRLGALSRVSRRCGSKGKRMAAGAGVPASIADRAAIVAALHVLCALPECARGALNALGVFAGFRRHRNCRNCIGTGGGVGNAVLPGTCRRCLGAGHLLDGSCSARQQERAAAMFVVGAAAPQASGMASAAKQAMRASTRRRKDFDPPSTVPRCVAHTPDLSPRAVAAY